MILALISGIAVITFFATGNRQVKEIFRKGDLEYSIIYVGQYDEGGNITDGKLSFSDNTSADITANGDGTYTVNYSNGTVYVGKFESMHRNGKGTLTFKNARVPREVAAALDKNFIMIETDAPYLAPHPNRGKLNHSGYLEYINRTLSEILGISEEETAILTEKNARRFFGLEK